MEKNTHTHHLSTEDDKSSYISPKTEFTSNQESTTQLMHEETQLNIQNDETKGCCTNGIFKNKKTRLYIILGIIGILILSILLVFFVIIPLIIQSYANSTEINM